MNFSAQFKQFLLSSGSSASKATVKNYIADVNKFIKWFEAKFNKSFSPSEVSESTIISFKNDSLTSYSASSVERNISSLRKFFTFLKLEGQISHSPFDEKKVTAEEVSAKEDPWRLKDFKNYLYVFNASHLTIKNYIIDIKQFTAWAEEVTAAEANWDISTNGVLSHVDSHLINEYKDRLLNEAKLSPVSVNRKLSSLRKYFSWAESEGIISSPVQVLNESRESDIVEKDFTPSALAQEPISVGKSSKYSAFPPLRLAQKIINSSVNIADGLIIFPLVTLAHKADYGLWVLKGKPVIEANSSSFLGKLLTSNATRNNKVKNVAKEFYAPALVSTKYFPFHKKVLHHVKYTRPYWYKRYQNTSFVRFAQLAILTILLSALSYAVYSNLGPNKNQTKTLAALPTAPPRVLSFQGRLTDTTDNPITSPTAIRMAIYNNQSASGGALLWQEIVTVTPDSDGIFATLLGNNTTIPQSVFGENSALYLGVTVGMTPELTPRQQIATVAFATNSETLQGLEPITNSANTTNVVLALNSSGNLSIGGSANPVFQSTGGSFTVQGTTLLLSTVNGSGGNVKISPDGLGKIDLQKPLQNNTLTNNLPTARGAVEVNDLFAILATSSGQSAFTLNQDSTGPLISASTSGVAKFTVDNGGNLTAAGTLNGLTISSGTITSGTWNGTAISPTYGGTGLNTSGSTGVPYISGGTWSVDANQLAANHGGTGIGSYTTGDLIYASGTSTLSKLGVGTAAQCLIGGTTPTWGSCGTGTGTNWWTTSSDGKALTPINSTMDFLLGGQATTSAKFAVLGLNDARGSQIASLSGDLILDKAGSIQTTKSQSLILGGTTTGLVQVNNKAGSAFTTFDTVNGRVGIGTSTPQAALTIVGGSIVIDSGQRLSLDSTNPLFWGLQKTGVDIELYGQGGAGSAFRLASSTTGNLSLSANFSDQNVGIGTESQTSQLQVTRPLSYGANGKALAVFDQLENQDILTASKSGVTQFIVDNVGNVGLEGSLYDPTGSTVGVNDSLDVVGSLNVGTGDAFQVNTSGAIAAATGITSSGTITFSNAAFTSEDNAVIYAGAGGLLSTATTTSSGLCLTSNGSNAAPSWASCPGGSGTNYWNLNSSTGVISPINGTVDLLLGFGSNSPATTSAKFAVTGMAGSGPATASVSGNFIIQPQNGAGGRLGIGTNTPTSEIDVIKNWNSGTNAYLTNSSNGTSAYAEFGASNGTGFAEFGIGGTGYTDLPLLQNRAYTYANSSTDGLVLYTSGTADPILFAVDDTEVGRFDGQGEFNVGGDTDANALFTVGSTSQFQVNSSGAIAATTGFTQASGAFAFSGGGNFSVDSAAFDVTTGGAISGVTTFGASGVVTLSNAAYTGNNAVIYGTTSTGVLAAATTSSSGLCLLSGAGAGFVPSWGSCGGTSDWTRVAGNLSPTVLNDTISATSSAANPFTATTNNPAGTLTNNSLIQHTAAGTVTNLLTLSRTAGTATTGLNFSGTIGTDISLQNGETISNASDGTVNITSPLTTFTGSARGVADDTYFSWDYTTQRIGFTKKAGATGKLTYGSANSFAIAQSNATDIAATNTFTDRFVLDSSGNVTIGAGNLTMTSGTSITASALTTFTTSATLAFSGDIRLNGNDILDSAGTTRITTGATTTLTNTTTTLSGTTTLTAAALATLTSSTTLSMNPNTGTTYTLNTTGTTLNLFNTTAATFNFAGAATSFTLGATTGTMSLRNPTVNVGNGGNATIATTSNGNLTLTAAGTGTILLSSDYRSGVQIGSAVQSTPLAPLYIRGGIGNNAALIVNNLNNGNLFTASASGTTRFTIDTSGNTTMTGYIDGSDSIQFAGTIDWTIGQDSIGQAANCAQGTGGVLCFSSGSTAKMSLSNAGQLVLNSNLVQNGSPDVAENIQVVDQSIEAADILAATEYDENNSDTYDRAIASSSTGEYQSQVIGVVSSDAGILLNSGMLNTGVGSLANERALAIAGRIPTKISTINGTIRTGDPITSSSISKFGMKATRAGTIVGKALEDFDPANGKGTVIPCPAGTAPNVTCGKILTLLNVSFYDPDVYLTSTGNVHIEQIAPIVDYNFKVVKNGENITRIGIYSEVVTAKIKVGFAEIQKISTQTITGITGSFQNITTNTLAIATSNITIAGTNIQDFIANIVDQRIAQNPGNGNIISPLETDGNNIAVKLKSNNENSKFIVKNASGSAVASIDGAGNASLSGQLTAHDASFSGILRADKIIANNIEGLNVQASSVSANYITNNYYISTPSGQTNTATPSGFFNQSATGSAMFGDLNAQTATFTNGLMSFGPTSFFEASVADRLFIGSQLSVADNSINVLGSDLKIQPLRQGNVSFMAGLVKIDTDGNLNVGGNSYFAKDVEVKGRLVTNIIAPLQGKDLIFEFNKESDDSPASKVQFKTGTESAVLSINNKGDINASGSGSFAKLNLKIVKEVQAVSDTEIIATGSAGMAEIKANREEITINNKLVSEDSLIYITPKTSLTNESVYLIRQVPGESFTVGISNSVNKKVQFNWIIIN